jgi:hypothetical protein
MFGAFRDESAPYRLRTAELIEEKMMKIKTNVKAGLK